MFFETYNSNYSPHHGACIRTSVPSSSRCQSFPEEQIPHQTASPECGLVASEEALSHLPTAEEPGGVKLSGPEIGGSG